MVLKRDIENPIWGQTEPNTDITVYIKNDNKTLPESPDTDKAPQNMSPLLDEPEEILKITGRADENGNFVLLLPPFPTGGPYTICITEGTLSERIINDVLFGDVYLLAGQSNMELPVRRTLDLTEEYCKTINNPNIRQFEVPKEYDFHGPVLDIFKGEWKKADQASVYEFSALGYFFAEYAYAENHVPVGLLQTACGGIQIEALIPEEKLLEASKELIAEAHKRGETREKDCRCGLNETCKFCLEDTIKRDKSDEYVEAAIREGEQRELSFHRWLNENDQGIRENWAKRTTLFNNNEEPQYVEIPGRWEDLTVPPASERDKIVSVSALSQAESNKQSSVQSKHNILGSAQPTSTPKSIIYQTLGNVRGSVWVLKRFEVPSELIGMPAKLSLGTIIDADETYINGVLVGETTYRYPPRRYKVPAGLLCRENTLTVRVKALQRPGGFVEEMPYFLECNGTHIDLSGSYEYKIGVDINNEESPKVSKYKAAQLADGKPNNNFSLPDCAFFLYKPCGVYNKMIYPLRRLKLTAMLFYQGESNIRHYQEYGALMRIMASTVRECFNDPSLELAFVELPYFGGEDEDRFNDNWDKLRLEQEQAAADIPYSILVDIYDLGFRYELHPQNKQEVAKRLWTARINGNGIT